MKFVIVSTHGKKGYEFYLQTTTETQYSEIKKRTAEVLRIKNGLSSTPENVSFGVTAPFDDPREEGVIDKDLWVFEPTITLATLASTDKKIAGKTFVELRDLAKDVITDLKRMENQNYSVPVRGSTNAYTTATIIAELETLSVDGLTFLNDWLINAVDMEILRMEKS